MKHLFECYYHFFLSNTQNQIKKNKIISAGHGPLGLFFFLLFLPSRFVYVVRSLVSVSSLQWGGSDAVLYITKKESAGNI